MILGSGKKVVFDDVLNFLFDQAKYNHTRYRPKMDFLNILFEVVGGLSL